MTRPRLLDLFCGAGGAAVGYHRAGFDVTGVDNRPQPRYPFTFHQADAMTYPLDGFDAIHASPPCQLFSEGAPGRKRDDHPDLLTPIRERLRAWGGCYVIENVATAPMQSNVLFCGSTFGLPLIRHRRFEINPEPLLVPSMCPQSRFQRGVAHKGRYSYGHGHWRPNWQKHVLPVVWPWMELEESGQAIPPAYTEYIGAQLLEHLKERAA
jgi:DNA (cytosine-5)-methyltransferase 1